MAEEGLHDRLGFGYLNIIGIRAEESIKRKKNTTYGRYGNKSRQRINYNELNEIKHECYIHGEKLLFYPILTWTEKEIWEFIKEKQMKYCSLYDNGNRRIGCILCPMTGKKQKLKEIAQYPKFAESVQTCNKVFAEK